MIAKRAHRRKDSKSSFSTLIEYITRDGKAAQKDGIEYSRITNCGFETIGEAILEIESTQARNTRSKIDKTYHLIVSFKEDEIVGQEKLFDIEDEICQAIGLGDHQRISTAHKDTDNLHIHIAINKIHPTSHLAIDPYYDYMKLDEACAALEFKHELQTDNRMANTQERAKDETLQSGKAGDMEAHNGMDSFQRWIGERKEDICKHLKEAKSWSDVHKGLGRYGLTIRPRGAGMVISAKEEKAFTKASDLGRKFSKGALEKRFGAYQPTSKDEVWKQRSEQIGKGRGIYAAKRRTVKTWKDFLIDHAAAGDPDAVVILRRSHRGKRKERGSAFLGNDEGQILLPMKRQTKPNGDVLYKPRESMPEIPESGWRWMPMARRAWPNGTTLRK